MTRCAPSLARLGAAAFAGGLALLVAAGAGAQAPSPAFPANPPSGGAPASAPRPGTTPAPAPSAPGASAPTPGPGSAPSSGGAVRAPAPGAAPSAPGVRPQAAPAARPPAPANPRGVQTTTTERILERRRTRTYAGCNRGALRRALKGGERRRFITRCRLGYDLPPRS